MLVWAGNFGGKKKYMLRAGNFGGKKKHLGREILVGKKSMPIWVGVGDPDHRCGREILVGKKHLGREILAGKKNLHA